MNYKEHICFGNKPRMGKTLKSLMLLKNNGKCIFCDSQLTKTASENSTYCTVTCPECNYNILTKDKGLEEIPLKREYNPVKSLHEIYNKVCDVYYDEPTRIKEIIEHDHELKLVIQKYDNIVKSRLKKDDIQLIQKLDTTEKSDDIIDPIVYPRWEDFMEDKKE